MAAAVAAEAEAAAAAAAKSSAVDPSEATDTAPDDSAVLRSELEEWIVHCQAQQKVIEKLVADALESSCNRGMFGAMNVFEAGNTMVERMGRLLLDGRCLEAECDAPLFCSSNEWRIAAWGVRSPQELEALRTLTVSLQDCPDAEAREPATHLRFLRAQEGHVEKAARMLRASLDWRSRYRISERSRRWQDQVAAGSSWQARLVNEYKVHRVVCRDRLGLPVYLFRWGVFDLAGAEREMGVERVLRVMLSIHEDTLARMRSAMFREGELPPGGLIIWDLGNYGVRGDVPNWWGRMLALVRFLPKVAKLLETNYPEMVRRIIVVRSGSATKMLYNTAVPFLPTRTLAKVKIHGSRAVEWAADLREEIGPEEFDGLPAFLTRDDRAALDGAEPPGGVYPVGAAASFREAARRKKASRDDARTPKGASKRSASAHRWASGAAGVNTPSSRAAEESDSSESSESDAEALAAVTMEAE
jgi:hypothetical protein